MPRCGEGFALASSLRIPVRCGLGRTQCGQYMATDPIPCGRHDMLRRPSIPRCVAAFAYRLTNRRGWPSAAKHHRLDPPKEVHRSPQVPFFSVTRSLILPTHETTVFAVGRGFGDHPDRLEHVLVWEAVEDLDVPEGMWSESDVNHVAPLEYGSP